MRAFKLSNWVTASALAAVCAFGAAAASDKNYRAEYSGTGYGVLDADADGDMQGGTRSRNQGKGTGGHFNLTSQTDLLPWDGSSFCAFDDAGNPIAVELFCNAGDAAFEYQPGDFLTITMAGSPVSSVCFNFLTLDFTFVFHAQVTGGTGRYTGATGQTVTRGRGRNMTPNFFLVKSAVITGTVNRAK